LTNFHLVVINYIHMQLTLVLQSNKSVSQFTSDSDSMQSCNREYFLEITFSTVGIILTLLHPGVSLRHTDRPSNSCGLF